MERPVPNRRKPVRSRVSAAQTNDLLLRFRAGKTEFGLQPFRNQSSPTQVFAGEHPGQVGESARVVEKSQAVDIGETGHAVMPPLDLHGNLSNAAKLLGNNRTKVYRIPAQAGPGTPP